MTGDRPIAALVRTDWHTSGGSTHYSAVRPATEVIVPYHSKRSTGDNIALAVMSDGDAAADVDLTLFDMNGAVAYETRYTFAAHEARLVLLPVVRDVHMSTRMTTSIVVHIPSSVAAGVTLTVSDDKGAPLPACEGCRATVPPGGARLFASSIARFMPPESTGSARIDSAQPVVAVVNEHSEAKVWDSAIYAGIPVPDEPQRGPLLAPFLTNGDAELSWHLPLAKRYLPWGDATRP